MSFVLAYLLLGILFTTAADAFAFTAPSFMLIGVERRIIIQNFLAVVAAPNAFDFSKPLTQEAAYERFALGQESIEYLLENYDKIVSNGGGDNVRRYLGTVGTSSGLWGMSKVLSALKDEAEDVVAFTEAKAEFESAIVAADGAAYMAIFVVTSSSSTPPGKYFADAKREVVVAKKYLQEIADLIGKR